MKIFWKILFLIFLVTLAACDLFKVRDPENPSETKSSYRVPVEPSDVIQNLINAFKDKNPNDYKKNFSTGLPLVNRNFFFVPSGNVLTSFPTDWSVDEEFHYFNNLVSRSPQDIPITMSFTNEVFDVRGDSSIYSAKYFLSVPVLNANPNIYEGNLKFSMMRDINAAWVIYYWEDIAIQDSKSWSELKIAFYP